MQESRLESLLLVDPNASNSLSFKMPKEPGRVYRSFGYLGIVFRAKTALKGRELKYNPSNKLNIFLLEDDPFVSFVVKSSCPDWAALQAFKKLEDCVENCDLDQEPVVVVTDYHFDGSVNTGAEVAKFVRSRWPSTLVLSFSNASLNVEEDSLFDGRISKDNADFWDEVLTFLS